MTEAELEVLREISRNIYGISVLLGIALSFGIVAILKYLWK